MYRFQTITFPRISNSYLGRQFLAALYFRSGKSNNAIFEFSIAQTVPERIQRITCYIFIESLMTTSAFTTIIIDRNLPIWIRESHSQFTGRVDTSRQYSSHWKRTIHTRLPNFQYSIRNRFQPVQFQRASVHQYQHDGFADFLQLFCQFFLNLRQCNRGTRSILTTPSHHFAQTKNNDIRPTGCF